MTIDAASVIFWVSLGIIFYILFGHGVLLTILRVFFRKPVKRASITPSVLFIIPAYNEEKDIEAKLRNTIALDYPCSKLRIVVVSDGSIDGTDKIVKRFSKKDNRIMLLRMQERGGRTVAINEAARRYKAEVYAISDANIYLDSKALSQAMDNFADPEVGTVTSRFVPLEGIGNPAERGILGYWNYEQKIRFFESEVYSLAFVSGCFNAIRSNLMVPVPADVTHDHFVPAYLAQKGFRSVYEPNAVAYEYPARSPWKETEIRGRNFLMGVNFMKVLPSILNVFKHPWFFINLLFRKILRWFTPVFILSALVSAAFLIPEIPAFVVYGFLGAGMIICGAMLIFKHPPRWISIVGFSLLSQIGLMWGIVQFISGKRIVTWNPPR